MVAEEAAEAETRLAEAEAAAAAAAAAAGDGDGSGGDGDGEGGSGDSGGVGSNLARLHEAADSARRVVVVAQWRRLLGEVALEGEGTPAATALQSAANLIQSRHGLLPEEEEADDATRRRYIP
jgi:hypothetical protein